MSRAKMIRMMGRVPGVGRALRWYANRYPEGSVVTIPSGFAQGMRWKRSHVYVNGYWVGQHELEVQAAIARLLSAGDGFIDLGANAGFFMLVGAKRIGPSGWCVAVDPDAFNCDYLRAQIELNDLKNCTVLQQAAADCAGMLKFVVVVPGDSTGHLADDAGDQRSIDVQATTIDAICAAHPKPKLIKVDVEGAEVRVLRGATQTLKNTRPIWLMESHSEELGKEVRRILSAANYRFTTLAGEPLPPGELLPYHSIALPL
jgi:FkbM family methyltransferase